MITIKYTINNNNNHYHNNSKKTNKNIAISNQKEECLRTNFIYLEAEVPIKIFSSRNELVLIVISLYYLYSLIMDLITIDREIERVKGKSK